MVHRLIVSSIWYKGLPLTSVNTLLRYSPIIPRERIIIPLTDAICKTNNAEFIYAFAVCIDGASIEMLTDAIINTGDIKYITLFAKNVKNAPTGRLQEYISRNENYLEQIEQENYKILIKLAKSYNYEQIKENKEEFASLFNNNKPKKLIKKKTK